MSPSSNTATVHDAGPVRHPPPTVPTGLTAAAVSASQVNLTWGTSSDNVGVTGYTVYRNGTAIATTTGPNATAYSDLCHGTGNDVFVHRGRVRRQPGTIPSRRIPAVCHHAFVVAARRITLDPVADTYVDSANPTLPRNDRSAAGGRLAAGRQLPEVRPQLGAGDDHRPDAERIRDLVIDSRIRGQAGSGYHME